MEASLATNQQILQKRLALVWGKIVKVQTTGREKMEHIPSLKLT